MPYAVLLRFDAGGVRALIVGQDSPPLTREEGVRYRLVTVAGTHAEAVRVVETLQRRIEAGDSMGSGGSA